MGFGAGYLRGGGHIRVKGLEGEDGAARDDAS